MRGGAEGKGKKKLGHAQHGGWREGGKKITAGVRANRTEVSETEDS